MAFLAIKNNPFDGLAEQWKGVSSRVPQAATVAAAVASDVLVETVRERAGTYDRWDDDLIGKVDAYQGPEGYFQVGLLSADEDDHRRAMEAEYGDTEHKPQPLMRTSTHRAKEEAQRVFNDVLKQGLFG